MPREQVASGRPRMPVPAAQRFAQYYAQMPLPAVEAFLKHSRGEQDPERTMTLLEECIATGETRRRVYAGSARNPLKTSATEGGRKGV